MGCSSSSASSQPPMVSASAAETLSETPPTAAEKLSETPSTAAEKPSETPSTVEAETTWYTKVMKKVGDQTDLRNDKRSFAFAIRGSEVDGLTTVCNSIGIFGIITFDRTGVDAGMQQKVKEMFEGLMKFELCATKDFISVFKDIQHVFDERIYQGTDWSTMGQLSCTLIACHGDSLSLTSSDGKTRVKIIRERGEGLEVLDVTNTIGQCLLGGGLGNSSRKYPRTVTRQGSSDERFLVIQSGNDDIDLGGELSHAWRSAQSLEQTVSSLRGDPAGPVIVVDLR